MKDDRPQKKAKTLTADWLVQGVLTKIGDTFDRLTGRGWNPSSSLATSKLIEKLKFLLDSKADDLGKSGIFVPHNIKLMIQWDKFSTDSEEDLISLEHELHAAAIDHINDRLYHTHAPIVIEIKTDYFTEGVRLLGSFGHFSDTEEDDAAVNVTIPNLRRDEVVPARTSVILNADEIERERSTFTVRFITAEKKHEFGIDFTKKKRFVVGRAKQNDIVIADRSVSKIHGSLVLNPEKVLLVADTGSTNGTFVGGKRIIYGKAFEVEEGGAIKFGEVEVEFERCRNLGKTREFNAEKESDAMPATEAFVDVDAVQKDNDVESKNDMPEIIKHEGELLKPLADYVEVEDGDLSESESKKRSDESDSQDFDIGVNTNETQDWEI